MLLLQADPVAQLVDDMAWSGYISAYQNIVVAIATCQTVEPRTVSDVEDQTNQFAQRAADLADATSGEEHARAIAVKEALDTIYFKLTNPVVPDTCDQP
jgi:hypothetical protein